VHVLQRQVPAHHEAALPHAAPAQGQPCTLRQQAHASQGTTAASRYSFVRQFRGTLQLTAVLRIQFRIRSVMFLDLPDRILPSSSKTSVLQLLYDFLSLKNDVNVPVFRMIRRYGMSLGLSDPYPDLFVRGTDPRIRNRIRIRTKMLRIRNIS
jgi:hypothetical protein